jgi:hypothetical protein
MMKPLIFTHEELGTWIMVGRSSRHVLPSSLFSSSTKNDLSEIVFVQNPRVMESSVQIGTSGGVVVQALRSKLDQRKKFLNEFTFGLLPRFFISRLLYFPIVQGRGLEIPALLGYPHVDEEKENLRSRFRRNDGQNFRDHPIRDGANQRQTEKAGQGDKLCHHSLSSEKNEG